MNNSDFLSVRHPSVSYLYFAAVFLFSMFCIYPICLAVSFVSAFLYYTVLKGAKSAFGMLRLVFPMIAFTTLINALFNHTGKTVLFLVSGGVKITLESTVYGLAAGFMLASVVMWFACFSVTVTSDKTVYAFGRFAPSTALLISMTLRFFPHFAENFKSVSETQVLLGHDINKGNVIKRVKNAVACFSAVVTMSLENAVETADSMKSRGYGNKNRTSFSVYEFCRTDAFCIIIICILIAVAVSGAVFGKLSYDYFPKIDSITFDFLSVISVSAFSMLFFMPLIFKVRGRKNA